LIARDTLGAAGLSFSCLFSYGQPGLIPDFAAKPYSRLLPATIILSNRDGSVE
jgi:hypothetical protein